MSKINPVLRTLFVGCTSIALLIGCGEKATIAPGDIDKPTVDAYDSLTNEPAFTLTGKRSPNTIIWYQLVGQPEAVKAVGASADTTWSFDLTLNEGSNRITLTASTSDQSVYSESVQVVITLDTIAPEPPVVNAHSASMVMGEQTSIPMNLSGTKDSDGSLDLDSATLIQVDGQTGWTTTVDVVAGVNTYSFTSTDLAGNVSKATLVSIAGTTASVGAVTIEDIPNPTRQDPYPLVGTKPANTSLWLVQLEAGDSVVSTEPVEIVPTGDDLNWTYNIDLGEGQNSFYVYAQTPEGSISVPASAETVLDTIAPEAPILDEVSESTGAATVQITGTRAADGNLCLRRDQEPTCSEIDGIGASVLDYTTSLVDGDNFICFSSIDLAGNTSPETCVTIYKLLGPSITIITPEAGSVLSSASVVVEAEILGGTESGAQVADVEICLDDVVECEPGTGSGDNWQATLPLSSVENGTLHTITETATNGVGIQSSASLTFLYQAGSLLLSDTNSPGHSGSVSVNHDSDGAMHVVWTDECVQFPGCITYSQGDNNAPWDILYRKFDASGWSDILLISSPTDLPDGDSGDSHSVIDSNGLLHIVWSDTGDSLSITDYDIFHRTLNVNTGEMNQTQVVANSDRNDDEPQLAAAEDGSVHLIWRRRTTSTDHDIQHTRWTAADGWGLVTEVSNDVGDGNSRNAVLALDSDSDAHIVWQDDGTVFSDVNTDDDIYYRSFENGTLQNTTLISNSGSLNGTFDDALNADSRAPSISISENDLVYIGWHDELNLFASSSDYDVFFQVLDSSGDMITTNYQSFDLNNAMSEYHSSGVHLQAIDDDNVVVFWSERNANGDANISMLKATRVGTSATYTWNSPELVLVTSGGENAGGLGVFIDADDLAHLVWSDDVPAGDDDEVRPNNEGEDFDVFYQAVPLP
ncbi:MAG: hypothetical protein HOI23_02715 [Deltaproteobacteria bacterium]|nr:hypothetical protein [Deltaproteobacteria bacterium]